MDYGLVTTRLKNSQQPQNYLKRLLFSGYRSKRCGKFIYLQRPQFEITKPNKRQQFDVVYMPENMIYGTP